MKKKRFAKKLTAVLMAAVMLLFCAPVLELAGLDIGLTKASAASTTKSGTFAKTLKWSFNTVTQKLTISGKGAIPDFDYDITDNFEFVSKTPWKKYKPLSLEIKSGVTKIGANAFSNCSLLTSVTVADSVEYISDGNFDSSIWMLKQINKNKGVVYIGKNLYLYAGNSTSVTVKDSTVSISPSAFAYNEKLQSVTLPSSLKTIGYGAFEYCEALKSIKIPKSVKTIEDCAFEGCSLSSVSLSEGLKTIGYGAFAGCEKLKSVTIPSTVSKIDESPFSDCYSLTKISVSEKNKYYCSDKYGVLYNKNKTTLIQFPAASKVTSYSVASTVTKIADSAFSVAENLKKITLPSKLKTIGYYAFSECSSLATINFPKTVETADYTCIEDTNWYAVQPIGMIYIGQVAAGYKGNMSKNTKISIKKGTTSIAAGAFSGIFGDYENLSSVTLPSGIKSIGEYAFGWCENLKSINLPSTLKTIGRYAFTGCGLTSVVIPAKVTKIEAGTFAGCENLKSIKIMNPLCDVPTPDTSEDSELLIFASNAIPKKAKIIAFKGSSAEAYAKKNGNTFTALEPVSLKNCTVSAIATQKYTGKALSPAVKVTYQGAALKSGKHFTVTYSNNTKVGTAKVTIKGNSKYGFTGTVTTTFKIAK
ncbi:MAG: leucine-rich repeat protein [Acutalibacteraceae bacterium]